MKILITGGNGQLGTELQHIFQKNGVEYTAADVQTLDITDAASVDRYFTENKPEIVYHCAAYTAVDPAEEEPGKTIDRKVNVDGTVNVAKAAEKVGALLVYVSTDYVFDGEKDEEYLENDPKSPLNQYGITKSEGEDAVQELVSKYYIVRTSWVYGEFGKNFVYTMQNLAKDHDSLTVVDDQVGRPTWTKTLADFLIYLVENKSEYGIYQLSNDGVASWYDFAKEILKDANVAVAPVTSDKFPQKATRPKHAVMSLEKAKATGFVIPTWQEALHDFLESIK